LQPAAQPRRRFLHQIDGRTLVGTIRAEVSQGETNLPGGDADGRLLGQKPPATAAQTGGCQTEGNVAITKSGWIFAPFRRYRQNPRKSPECSA
jgi:hypothetical protein